MASSGALEQQRLALEDIDRLENAIAERVTAHSASKRANMLMQHQIAQFLEKAQQRATEFENITQDASGERRKDILDIQNAGHAMEGFHERVRAIRAFHRKYPGREIENLEESYKLKPLQDLNYSLVDEIFSGEERYGRFLDMNRLHEQYINIKGVKPMSITNYLDSLTNFDSIPSRLKNSKYIEYLDSLIAYLKEFYQKTRPLQPTEKAFEVIQVEFEIAWNAGKFSILKNGELTSHEGKMVNGTDSPEQRPLFCKACNKLYSKNTVFQAHLSGKHHKKLQRRLEEAQTQDSDAQKSENAENATAFADKSRKLAEREFTAQKIAGLLSKELKDTRENIVRKQTLTSTEWEEEMESIEAAELEAEMNAATEENNDDDELRDSDGKLYNPLKLPLGWDGKPIPFWLWKLHGLGVEYPCEICGNYVYMGRKNFDKHFLEQRHVYGLKCLGIQPSHLFSQITSIQDAISVWNKIRRDKRATERRNESAMEVEDSEGNVMSERVYNDLKAQVREPLLATSGFISLWLLIV